MDPCTLNVNKEECLSEVMEWCIPLNSGCRTAKMCEDYSELYMEVCDEVPGCSVVGGVKKR
jgi:hypothetical protein